MSGDRPQRLVHAIAALDPATGFGDLGREDWKTLCDVFEFDTDALAILASTGIWDDVNARCGAWIDIYEEAEIAVDELGVMLDCVGRAEASEPGRGPEAVALLGRLRALTQGAKARGVPVWLSF